MSPILFTFISIISNTFFYCCLHSLPPYCLFFKIGGATTWTSSYHLFSKCVLGVPLSSSPSLIYLSRNMHFILLRNFINVVGKWRQHAPLSNPSLVICYKISGGQTTSHKMLSIHVVMIIKNLWSFLQRIFHGAK